MEQIVCKNLCLGYDGNIVSRDIHFPISQGDYLCIVGENGTGKSTLMKALLGLHPPISGEIMFQNGQKQREIGYLPQRAGLQRGFPASVQEVVLSGCLNQRGHRFFYNRQERAQAQKIMEELGIGGLQRRCFRELSGGQQQRVLLARALCATRKLLLLDEPVSGLDPDAAADMYAVLRKLNRQGTTIVMISHDIAAAVREASHILHLSREPLFFGTKEDYLHSEAGKRFLHANEEAQA